MHQAIDDYTATIQNGILCMKRCLAVFEKRLIVHACYRADEHLEEENHVRGKWVRCTGFGRVLCCYETAELVIVNACLDGFRRGKYEAKAHT